MEPISFNKIQFDIVQKQSEQLNQGPTVADELNARLALLQARNIKCKSIRPLAKTKPAKLQYTYKFQCICPLQSTAYQNAQCQHMGQIIIDRDVLTKDEHICYLAMPKKVTAGKHIRRNSVCVYKKIILPNCTAHVERLAEPGPKRIKETLRKFKSLLPERQTKALKQQLVSKSLNNVDVTSLDKALESMEEEQRRKRVLKQLHRSRCRKLRKRILQKQRKQIRKIVCVLFEEMKEFLLNDQFIIDDSSPLCAVILERIKGFTDQEFYTTTNMREYQSILANNITVWINKFILNLNIHLTSPAAPLSKAMHVQQPGIFIPISGYISDSEVECEEEEGNVNVDIEDVEASDYILYPEEYIVESIRTESTIRNIEET